MTKTEMLDLLKLLAALKETLYYLPG